MTVAITTRQAAAGKIKESKMVNAYVFPGQGSQKRGMGAALFDTTPEFLAVESDVNAIVGYSMRELCLKDPGNNLGNTQYTQPSLYVVNALHYFNAVREGRPPSFVAGHSLGEYNALHAAGVFDFLTGLKLVKRRGELMAQASGGGMAAVIGLSASRVAQAMREHRVTIVEVANYNSPTQTVISGPVAELKRIGPVFEQAGAQLYVPLAVSAAFHSRYVSGAAQKFEQFLESFTFNSPRIPVVTNVTAQTYPLENPTQNVRKLLVKQMTSSVLWTQTVLYLLDRGVREFKEIGPGNVLTRLIQQTRQDGASTRTPAVAIGELQTEGA
jgi:malonyl CoA-acyl carrier protein transacylase